MRALIKTNVLALVGLKVCIGAGAVYNSAESMEHRGSDSTPLKIGLDGYRAEVPVRHRRIAPRPLADPPQDAKRRWHRITDHGGRKYSCLFDCGGLTESRARHSANSDEAL
jgi:hypothetical protein